MLNTTYQVVLRTKKKVFYPFKDFISKLAFDFCEDYDVYMESSTSHSLVVDCVIEMVPHSTLNDSLLFQYVYKVNKNANSGYDIGIFFKKTDGSKDGVSKTLDAFKMTDSLRKFIIDNLDTVEWK